MKANSLSLTSNVAVCMGVFVCLSAECASDMLTFSAVWAPHFVMCQMCELEPCLACQSDDEIIRGVTLKSLISLISCQKNDTNLPVRSCQIQVHEQIKCYFPCKFCSGVLCRVPLQLFCSGQEMTPSWGPYGPHVGSTLLSNSARMAISTTFARDGIEPETCHLCFTVLSLKTRMCMYVHARMCVCMHVCQQA